MSVQSPRLLRFDYALPLIFTALVCLILVGITASPKLALQGGGAVLGMLGLSYLILHRDIWPRLREQIGFLAGLCLGAVVLIALSSLWAVNPDAALNGAPRAAALFIPGLAIVALARFMPAPTTGQMLCLSVVILIPLLLFGVMSLTRVPAQNLLADQDSYISVINKGIAIATLMIPVAVFVWGRAMPRALVRWGYLAVLVALVALIALTSEAQAALLAVLIMAICAVLPINSARFWRLLRVVVVGGVLLAPMIATSLFTFADDIGGNETIRRASAAQRLEVWHAISGKIMEQPLLGYGYEGTRYLPHFDSAQLYQTGTVFSHPHNIALQFWMEYGVLGAVLGAVALALTLRRIERVADPRVRRLYFTTFCSTFAVALIGWGMWQGWWITLVFLLITTNIAAGRAIKPT